MEFAMCPLTQETGVLCSLWSYIATKTASTNKILHLHIWHHNTVDILPLDLLFSAIYLNLNCCYWAYLVLRYIQHQLQHCATQIVCSWFCLHCIFPPFVAKCSYTLYCSQQNMTRLVSFLHQWKCQTKTSTAWWPILYKRLHRAHSRQYEILTSVEWGANKGGT